MYDFEPEYEEQLPFVRGDILTIVQVETEEEGWYFAKGADGRRGLVPHNYLGWEDEYEASDSQESEEVFESKIEARTEETNAQIVDVSDLSKYFYEGFYDYAGVESEHLSFSQGDELKLISKETGVQGWWLMTNLEGKQGLVPFNYVQLVFEDASPYNEELDCLQLPSGARSKEGCVWYPDGSEQLDDGSFKLKDETVLAPEERKVPEGALVLPDSTALLLSGEIQYPTAVVRTYEGQLRLPNGDLRQPDWKLERRSFTDSQSLAKQRQEAERVAKERAAQEQARKAEEARKQREREQEVQRQTQQEEVRRKAEEEKSREEQRRREEEEALRKREDMLSKREEELRKRELEEMKRKEKELRDREEELRRKQQEDDRKKEQREEEARRRRKQEEEDTKRKLQERQSFLSSTAPSVGRLSQETVELLQRMPKVPDDGQVTEVGYFFEALYDWEAQPDRNQIGLFEGQHVSVESKQETEEAGPGWWLATNAVGEQGLVPYNYIQLAYEGAEPDENDMIVLPSGARSTVEGTIEFPCGSVELPDGSVQMYDGSVVEHSQITEELADLCATCKATEIPDLTARLPCGSIYYPSGAISLHDGRLRMPNASVVDALWTLPPSAVPANEMGRQPTGTLNEPSSGSEAGSSDQEDGEVAALNQAPSSLPLQKVYYFFEAVYGRQADDDYQLSFSEGDKLLVRSRQTDNDGWWEAESIDGSIGLVPYNHLHLTFLGATCDEDQTVLLPSGAQSVVDGQVRYPDGSFERPEGTVELPDGAVRPRLAGCLPDGTVQLSSGCFKYPSGATTTPEGLLRWPDGRVTQPEWDLPKSCRGSVRLELVGDLFPPAPMDALYSVQLGGRWQRYFYEAMYDFEPQNEDQVALSQDEELRVLQKRTEEEGWWLVEKSSGEEGLVPFNYIQLVVEDGERFDDDSILLPSGVISTVEGTLRYPDGCTSDGDGALTLPDGTKREEVHLGVPLSVSRKCVRLPDETFLLANGQIQYPSGMVCTKDGKLRTMEGDTQDPLWEIPAATTQSIQQLDEEEEEERVGQTDSRTAMSTTRESERKAAARRQQEAEEAERQAAEAARARAEEERRAAAAARARAEEERQRKEAREEEERKQAREAEERRKKMESKRVSGVGQVEVAFFYEALYSFEGESSEYLRLFEGDRLQLLSKTTQMESWWEMQKEDGARGLVPYNYVQLVFEGAPEDQVVTLPTGSRSEPDGNIRYPDGSYTDEGGTGVIILPDDKGDITPDELRAALLNGEVLLPDLTVQKRDGTLRYPSGACTDGSDSMLVLPGMMRVHAQWAVPKKQVIKCVGIQLEFEGRGQQVEAGDDASSEGVPQEVAREPEADPLDYFYVALFDYEPTSSDQLPLAAGDVVTVLENREEWRLVRSDDNLTGEVPYNYIQLTFPGGHREEDDSIVLPSGAISIVDGILEFPDGTRTNERGDFILSDGSVRSFVELVEQATMFENAKLLLDGVAQLSDGTFVMPSGARFKDGQLVAPAPVKAAPATAVKPVVAATQKAAAAVRTGPKKVMEISVEENKTSKEHEEVELAPSYSPDASVPDSARMGKILVGMVYHTTAEKLVIKVVEGQELGWKTVDCVSVTLSLSLPPDVNHKTLMETVSPGRCHQPIFDQKFAYRIPKERLKRRRVLLSLVATRQDSELEFLGQLVLNPTEAPESELGEPELRWYGLSPRGIGKLQRTAVGPRARTHTMFTDGRVPNKAEEKTSHICLLSLVFYCVFIAFLFNLYFSTLFALLET